MCCGVGCNIEGTVWPLYCIVGGNILYFSERGGVRTVLGIAASLLGIIAEVVYLTCPIAFYLIWLYSGERKDKLPKYAYYIFYPVHLLVLGLAAKLFF